MSRIDRFLLSENWSLSWPNCFQMATSRGWSDHCSLLLCVDDANWGPKPVHMLKCWENFTGYKSFVCETWNSSHLEGWGSFVLREKLKLIKRDLSVWHRTHLNNLPARISVLKDRIGFIEVKGESSSLEEDEIAELHGLSEEVFALSRVNSSICWQQSRLQWLCEGGANSNFFHNFMSNRRRRNAIPFFLVNGVLVEGVQDVRAAVFDHFSSHYQAHRVHRPSMDGLFFRSLAVREGLDLIKPFSVEEVKNAVWDCESFKSPGPDGISFGFLKDFWDLLKGDVMRFLVEFHRNGKLAKGINSTFIALIRKVENPQSLNEFRPISLVGSMYKILAKVLANRIRLVIGSVISDAQSAFVKGRQILDGILIANEVVDDASKRKKELLLFKVDFEKAYDSIDWSFLEEVMVKMGFPILWRKWIKECVGTATASVLVNGSLTNEFSLGRGLRQGDPLSPFLFLLVAEGFNVLMEAMVARRLFHGYCVGSHDPLMVSHLQFADDTLILCEKSWANIRALRATLLIFEELSGLKVNFSKSLLVGVNVPGSWLSEASLVLNCKVGTIPFLYLELPIGGNASQLVFWKPLLNRINTRLLGWKSKHLSLVGRLVLLKVLVARNGMEDGFLRVGGRDGSVWWRNIAGLRSEGWFFNNVSHLLGDGTNVLFWTDIWLGELSLRDRFSRLYELSLFKGESVATMKALGWDEAGEAWKWKRRLFAWEEESVAELTLLLHNVSLQAQQKDMWIWKADSSSSSYTVQSAYKMIMTQAPLDQVTDMPSC
ncbi:putative RNA-directed DNA polymerase [Medicago truncatula]|uniref:Putative RNA-directed DNA polymerase n=1 Tax=Medicago truncatula TaxID=3880 RepID=A0A396IMZ8_MEDTR|nr:putative RNA-directed DNA polymerase [Medicago truncatula]